MPIASVPFHRDKYGRMLRVDANRLPVPGFITAPLPHRLQFHEIVLLDGASGEVEIDGHGIALQPARVCFTAPGDVRRWRLDGALQAWVVCFERELLAETLADAGWLDRLDFLAPGGTRHVDLPADARPRVQAIVDAMCGELRTLAPDCEAMLGARLWQLLLELARLQPPAGETPARHQWLHRRFVAEVEREHARRHRVGDYAARLGVSAAHLNAAVRRACGRTASALIQQRLLLEAQRRLRYTATPVVAIADDLGFADASYFNRFFRRLAGSSPGRYRDAYHVRRDV